MSATGTLAVLIARPAPYARATVEAGAALLGLRVTTYGPEEVAALGELAQAGERLSTLHVGLVAVGFGPGQTAALASRARTPVLNGGDPEGNPIAALADLQVLQARLGALAGRRLTWVGDASGLLYDLLCVGPAHGLSIAVAHPLGFAPDAERVTWARECAAETGAAIHVTHELTEAIADASVVYVDRWPEDHAERFRPYAVQRHTLRDARVGALVLHRCPEAMGPELSASYAEEVAAVAVDQTRARVDAVAALLLAMLRPDPLCSVRG